MSKRVVLSDENHEWLMTFLADAQERTSIQKIAHKIADVCGELEFYDDVETTREDAEILARSGSGFVGEPQ